MTQTGAEHCCLLTLCAVLYSVRVFHVLDKLQFDIRPTSCFMTLTYASKPVRLGRTPGARLVYPRTRVTQFRNVTRCEPVRKPRPLRLTFPSSPQRVRYRPAWAGFWPTSLPRTLVATCCRTKSSAATVSCWTSCGPAVAAPAA